MIFRRDNGTKNSLVGLAASPAYCVVAGLIDSRKLARRDKSCGTAVQAFRSHEQPFFPSLDGIFRPMPAFVHRRIWNHRAGGFLQPEEPPQRGRTRLGPMGRRISNRQTVPGQKEPKAKPYPDPAFPDGAGWPQAQAQYRCAGHRRIGRGKKPVLCDSQRFKLRGVLHGSLRSKK